MWRLQGYQLRRSVRALCGTQQDEVRTATTLFKLEADGGEQDGEAHPAHDCSDTHEPLICISDLRLHKCIASNLQSVQGEDKSRNVDVEA